MKKKVILSAAFFIFMLIAVPLILSLSFSNQTSGRIVVDQRVNAPYLKNSDKDWMLIYFGYVGCTKVCTPILHHLDEFYDSSSFLPLKNSVGFYFVNLMPEVQPGDPDQFAKAFNKQFNGFYLTQRELMSIDREFNLFFSKSLSDITELNHSDYLYLVHRQTNGDLILKNIYMTHPLNQKLIITDISKLQKEKE